MMGLEVKNLTIDFAIRDGAVQVLRDVSFKLEKGKSLGIVGESGSGKSVTSLAILRLLAPNAKVKSGQILYDNQDLLNFSESQMNNMRGKKIAMIFQDPMSSLDPCYTVGDQIKEMFLAHTEIPFNDLDSKIIELFKLVGLSDPEKRIRQYPHELSGGMNQRVMIAMALACNPDLIIADEPTTALDVTIQAQIMRLLREIKEKKNMSMILISHDLGLIAENVDDLIVMYAGEVVESGRSQELLKDPQHPYTQALLESMPATAILRKQKMLTAIAGIVPDLRKRPLGCQFADRCAKRIGACEQTPNLYDSKNRQIRCWLFSKP
jgi:peptide/nickel transport system ATP-binding protein